jgi:hypothetical protein
VWPVDGIAFAGAHTDLVEAWLRCGPVRARHTVALWCVKVSSTCPGLRTCSDVTQGSPESGKGYLRDSHQVRQHHDTECNPPLRPRSHPTFLQSSTRA